MNGASSVARVASRFARAAPVLAAAFAVGAVNHVVALATGRDDSPTWRHALFVVVNLAFAVGFGVRWRWMLVPSVALAVQQTWSHGSDFVEAAGRGAWDVASLVVLVLMPCVVLAAYGLARR